MAQRKNLAHRIQKRRADAQERQAKSDKLTTQEKLAKATPGSREYKKLEARVQK